MAELGGTVPPEKKTSSFSSGWRNPSLHQGFIGVGGGSSPPRDTLWQGFPARRGARRAYGGVLGVVRSVLDVPGGRGVIPCVRGVPDGTHPASDFLSGWWMCRPFIRQITPGARTSSFSRIFVRLHKMSGEFVFHRPKRKLAN